MVARSTAAASDNVIVGLCKPTGHIFDLPGGREVELNGYGAKIKGIEFAPLPDGGFGLTSVPAALWAEVKKIYGNHPFFKAGLIIESGDFASAEAQAEEKKEIKSGLEAVPQDTSMTGHKR